jgi:hypothetical protein
MLYAIIATDITQSAALRAAARANHLAYVDKLRADGRLILAGPHPAIDSPDPGPAGISGSLIVAEFDSLEAATAWASNDPYCRAGVFESVVVKPFLKVLP